MSHHVQGTILFVGTGDADHSFLTGALRTAGFQVQEAATEEIAIELAREEPELIILEDPLPGLSREAFCERIKADPHTAAVPVLHLGDRRPPSVGSADRGRHADGFLLVPVNPQELLTHVGALLRLSRSEAALRVSEARLRDILDHAPVVAHVKDLEGRYLLVNCHWETLFHFRREEVIGKCGSEIHPSEEAEALRANDLQVLRDGGPLEFEEVVSQDDGPHTFLSVKFALADDRGKPYAVCGIATDITARKRADAALRDSEALYHSLVESLPVCLLRKDVKGRFTFANRACCAALKRPLAEVVGKTDADFYPTELAGKYLRDDRRILESGEVFEDIEEHKDPEGDSTYVQVLKAPLHDARGEIIGVQALYWDVTAHKRAEAEAGRAAAEFGVARRIQQRLFPRTVPRPPGMDIAVASFGFDIGGASYPADAIGGDYYDFVSLPGGGLGVAIGDVSGHGVGPALLMAEVRAFFRAFAQTEPDIGAILGLMNPLLASDIEDDRFVTLLLARLDPFHRRFSYASAGHPPGFLLDEAGQVRRALGSTGTPLGVFPEATFPSVGDIELAPGDLVFLVTDGVMDARAPDGTRFGVQRTLDLVRSCRREEARVIVENLYYAVRAFGHNLPQYDDITATVIKVTGPEAPSGAART